jgi:putative transport protein
MLVELIKNPILIISFCILFGQLLGSIQIKFINLGSSGILFVGLFTSYFATKYLSITIEIPKILFTLSLIGFISAVGLLASKNIKYIIKKFGLKFLFLGLIITLTGTVSTYIFINLMPNIKAGIIGTYVGSLTSSPGLATALEISKSLPLDQSSSVGLGYSIAYVPGVLLVIAFTQLMAIKYKSENKSTKKLSINKGNKFTGFSIISYTIILIFGIILGTLRLNLSSSLSLSLGLTGGVLISSLAFGCYKKIGPLIFEFEEHSLNTIRDISLSGFLAIVGLNYGYKAFIAISTSGLELFIVGLVTGTLSILSGYLVGKYILKIDTIYLVGGICGGMTSTPGLASAIEAFEDDDIVSGYGATYPFALIFMILFTNLLFSIN